LLELERELTARGITLVLAGRQTEIRKQLREKEFKDVGQRLKHFPTLRQAVRAFQKEMPTDERPADTGSPNLSA